MSPESFPHIAIIIISVYVACAKEPVTEKPSNYRSFNHDYSYDYDNVEETYTYTKYETIDPKSGSTLPPVFDVTQYENECPPGKIVPRRSCEEEANLWKDYEESIQRMSTELCESFQDVIDKIMYYSCWVSPSVAESALNFSTTYIEKYTNFPENITHPNLEARKQEYIKSIHTVRNMKQALYVSEEVRKSNKGMTYGMRNVDFLEAQRGFLNKSKVYMEIEKEQRLLIEEIKSYHIHVENLTAFLQKNKLSNIFYTGELAKLSEYPLKDVIMPNQLNYMKDIQKKREMQQMVHDVQIYANPIFAAILLIIGLTGNLLLLSIFIKFKDMRTIANMMTINLTISDCLYLLLNLPMVYYKGPNIWHRVWSCRIFFYIYNIVVTVSTYSIVIISLQRFLAVKSFMKAGNRNKTRTFLMAVSVWLVGFLYGIPRLMFSSIEKGMCADGTMNVVHILVTVDLIFICIVPSILMIVFSSFTATNIRTSAMNAPGERTSQQKKLSNERIVSAYVLTALAVLFVISYFPNFFFYFLTANVDIKIDNLTYVVIDNCAAYLLFVNSSLNPVALGIMSKNYRKYYKELIRCYNIFPLKLFEGQPTTNASVSTTESSI